MTTRGRGAFPEMETPTNTRAGSEGTPTKREAGDPAKDDLLTLAANDPEEVVRRLNKEWDQSWKDISGFEEQWKVNLARSEGYLGARLDKVQDRQEAWIPYGSAPSITGLDKAARLSQRLVSAIFADEPKPDVVPSTGQDVAADNAQFQERILLDESSEGRLGYSYIARDAFAVAKDYGSGFLHFYIDPEGRGPEPVQIKAHPDAVSSDDPMPAAGPAGEPMSPKPPILRYVTEEGGLTDKRFGQPLQYQFLPKLCASILTGRHVRMRPSTARDIWDATGVLIGAMVPLGDVKSAFPSVMKMSDEELADLVNYRPNKAEKLLAPEHRKLLNESKVSDTSLVFQLLRYELPTNRTPKGSYFAAVGDSHLAHFGEWWDAEHGQPMDLPVTQFMHYRQFGNPYGAGANERLGPGNELLALILDAMLLHMDRFGDAKMFVPQSSNLRPEQLESESHRYIPYSGPTPPVAEAVPDFPTMYEKMYGRISAEMDDESALSQSGQAQQSPNVKSAKHFTANLQQVQVLLSDLKQNTARGLCRGWRIMAQQIRAYYTIPQLLKWEGDDGAYHVKEWAGADLIGLGDVQIAQGSFTGMLPPQKAALARELYLTDHVLTPDQYKRIAFGQFNPMLAVADDPHFQRVKRQIDRWLEGPPEGWQPPQPPVDAMGQPIPNPQNPQQPMPAPPDPLLADIFGPRPADDEPAVAVVRMQELGRVTATSQFSKFPEPWQAALVQAYQMARQSSQVPDAKQSQQVQEKLKQATEQLQKPHLSFSVALADLDATQSAEVLKQNGVNISPPSAPVAPPPQGLPPEHEVALELKKHEMTTQADIEKERIRAAAKVESDARTGEQKQAAMLAMKELMTSVKGGNGKKHTIKGPDGRTFSVESQ